MLRIADKVRFYSWYKDLSASERDAFEYLVTMGTKTGTVVTTGDALASCAGIGRDVGQKALAKLCVSGAIIKTKRSCYLLNPNFVDGIDVVGYAKWHTARRIQEGKADN